MQGFHTCRNITWGNLMKFVMMLFRLYFLGVPAGQPPNFDSAAQRDSYANSAAPKCSIRFPCIAYDPSLILGPNWLGFIELQVASWEFSDSAIRLVRQYKITFPQLFHGLARHQGSDRTLDAHVSSMANFLRVWRWCSYGRRGKPTFEQW